MACWTDKDTRKYRRFTEWIGVGNDCFIRKEIDFQFSLREIYKKHCAEKPLGKDGCDSMLPLIKMYNEPVRRLLLLHDIRMIEANVVAVDYKKQVFVTCDTVNLFINNNKHFRIEPDLQYADFNFVASILDSYIPLSQDHHVQLSQDIATLSTPPSLFPVKGWDKWLGEEDEFCQWIQGGDHFMRKRICFSYNLSHNPITFCDIPYNKIIAINYQESKMVTLEVYTENTVSFTFYSCHKNVARCVDLVLIKPTVDTVNHTVLLDAVNSFFHARKRHSQSTHPNSPFKHRRLC